jgi:glycosyltransferase involved in cell wall biosynthesis
MNLLISIIVPVYNMEKYLDRCMDSVLNQTYTNIEVILVDDGSTDSSPKMCDEYAEKDSRIKVVHKENGGLSDARNAGLKVATGAYIGYVDSDDWIEPDMYERMYNACVKNDAQLCVCRYFSEYDGKTVSGGTGKETVFDREGILRTYICGSDDYIIYNSVWSKLFKRELVGDMVFPKGRNSEDIMYTTKAFCRLEKAVYIDTCLYHYVLDRKDSIMNVGRSVRMFKDEIPFWREHIAYIKENVSPELSDLAAYYFWKRLLFYYTDASAKKTAKRLADEIKGDREEISRIYLSDEVSKGDRARMKLFMASPSLYALTVKIYERVIIPIRQKIR